MHLLDKTPIRGRHSTHWPLWAQQRTAMGGGGVLFREEGLADAPVIYRFLRHNIDIEKENRVSL
jgi:hypothetical protein